VARRSQVAEALQESLVVACLVACQVACQDVGNQVACQVAAYLETEAAYPSFLVVEVACLAAKAHQGKMASVEALLLATLAALPCFLQKLA